MNLFATAFRILQSEGEDAARTWYAALSPQEKEQFSSEIKTVTEKTIAAFQPIQAAISDFSSRILTAWTPLIEAWKKMEVGR